MRLWQRSIQWQLILSMGAALLASILIVVGIYAAVVNRLAEKALVDQALPASVAAIGNDLERILTEPLTAARSIAENSMVQEWLSAGEDAGQNDAFVRYLEGVQIQQKALTTFIVAAGSGNYFTEKGVDRTLTRGPAENSWFYSFVDGSESRVVQIDTDKTTSQPTLFINQRITANGKTLGLAGLGFGLQAMSDLIRNFKFGESGRIFLVSADGKVKIHPQSEFNDTRQLSDLLGRDAAAKLLVDSGKAVHFARDGKDFLAVAQPLKTLGWLLVSEVPEAEIYADANQALLTSSLIGLLVALFSLGLVVLLARGLVRPIKQVTDALVEIGGGGGDLTRRLDETRQDELGDLARGFNRFISSQRDLISAVLATSVKLRTAVGQVASVVENTAGRAGRQNEMTDMVATAVHEMGLTVQEIARNASSAATTSQSARDEALQARQVVGGLHQADRENVRRHR